MATALKVAEKSSSAAHRSRAMNFAYMPVLKWKQGEQLALRNFTPELRAHLLPLIELIDSKESGDAGVDAQIGKFAKELGHAGHAHGAVALDLSLHSAAAKATLKLLKRSANELEKKSVPLVPVLTPQILAGADAELALLKSFPRAVLRLNIDLILPEQIEGFATKAIAHVPEVHLLLDMASIVGTDPQGKWAEASIYVQAAYDWAKAASITLAGGSFPYNLMGIKPGTIRVPRVERQVWSTAVKNRTFKSLRFGDYAVTNPVPLPPIDPKMINPSAAIRYALQQEWMLIKGTGTRTAGRGQYNDLCRLLILEDYYAGEDFCYGDASYHKHAQKGASSGSPMSWRRDATSHHLELTTRMCLANDATGVPQGPTR